MTANQITVGRIGLAFLSIALLGAPGIWAWVAVVLIMFVLALDAVDGYVARRRKETSKLGAALDIAGDRAVENLYWIFFAVAGLISLWIPIVFLVRGLATDFLRNLAFQQQGRTAFGSESMMATGWGRALVGSRWSRAAYGIVKCVCFCYLAILAALQGSQGWPFSVSLAGLWSTLTVVATFLSVAATLFCIARGIPVLWEGRRYLKAA